MSWSCLWIVIVNAPARAAFCVVSYFLQPRTVNLAETRIPSFLIVNRTFLISQVVVSINEGEALEASYCTLEYCSIPAVFLH
jgi:hypothetical protein